MIKIGRRYLFATRSQDELSHLFRLGNDGDFHSICAFQQRSEPVTHVIFGKQNSVCADVASGKIKPIYFPIRSAEEMKSPENISVDNVRSLLTNGVKRLDIGNDGIEENVTILSSSRAGGRGCNWTQLVTTDDSGNKVPMNSLNRLLLGFLGESQFCGSDTNAFVHSGVTYIDTQTKNGDRSIYQLRRNEMKTACKFARHSITDVANEGEESK